MILTSQSEPRAVHSLSSRLRAPRCGCGESTVGMASPRAEFPAGIPRTPDSCGNGERGGDTRQPLRWGRAPRILSSWPPRSARPPASPPLRLPEDRLGMSLPNKHAGGKLSCVPEGGRGRVRGLGRVSVVSAPASPAPAVWVRVGLQSPRAWPCGPETQGTPPGPETGGAGAWTRPGPWPPSEEHRGCQTKYGVFSGEGVLTTTRLECAAQRPLARSERGSLPTISFYHIYAGKSPDPSPRQPNLLWSLWIDPMSHATRFH